ncbi:MAG: hypothetical protein Q7S80_02775 [bacterium]|nr:hypothetical protein [bacterium]
MQKISKLLFSLVLLTALSSVGFQTARGYGEQNADVKGTSTEDDDSPSTGLVILEVIGGIVVLGGGGFYLGQYFSNRGK